jgi:hypothetical protein
MKYPTIEEVQKASHHQLAVWCRFLPSPGWSVDRTKKPEEVEKQMGDEIIVNNLISERFKLCGGMTPELSKSIGWKEKP